jgi:hypothetical protein
VVQAGPGDLCDGPLAEAALAMKDEFVLIDLALIGTG